jgi:hypothetical protein
MNLNPRLAAFFFGAVSITTLLASLPLATNAQSISVYYLYKSQYLTQFNRNAYLTLTGPNQTEVVVSDRPANEYKSLQRFRSNSGIQQFAFATNRCLTMPKQGAIVWAAKCIQNHRLQAISFDPIIPNGTVGLFKWKADPTICISLAEEGKVEPKPCNPNSSHQLWRQYSN